MVTFFFLQDGMRRNISFFHMVTFFFSQVVMNQKYFIFSHGNIIIFRSCNETKIFHFLSYGKIFIFRGCNETKIFHFLSHGNIFPFARYNKSKNIFFHMLTFFFFLITLSPEFLCRIVLRENIVFLTHNETFFFVCFLVLLC